MTVTLVIPGRMPSLNEYIDAERTNRYKGAEMKRTEQARVLCLAKTQLRGICFSAPVRLRYCWYEQNRKRDLDNIAGFGHKVIQDGLVKAGVLKNDGWCGVVGFSDDFFVDKEQPRIVVQISDE